MGSKDNQPQNTQPKQNTQNDRQFRCKCKKSYKSYPALYTHIKNKHRDQLEEYKEGSKRPKQSEIDKGRPKKHRARPAQADEQGELLNIIQLGVLQIEKNLKSISYNDNDRFQVLIGNRKLQYSDLRKHYDKEKEKILSKIRETYPDQDISSVIDSLNSNDLNNLKQQIPIKIYKESIKFKQQLIQHFNAITAAKIILHLQLLQILSSNIETNKMNENNEIEFSIDVNNVIKLSEDTLWGNIEGITETIRNVVNKWNEKLSWLNSNSSYVSNHDSQQSRPQQDEDQSQNQEGSKQQQQNQQRHVEIMDYIESNY